MNGKNDLDGSHVDKTPQISGNIAPLRVLQSFFVLKYLLSNHILASIETSEVVST